MNKFNENKLLYKGIESKLLIGEIKKIFPKDFIGSKDFIELYLIYDGVDFMREAKMFRSKFYNVEKNESDQIGVSFFFSFKRIISEKANYNADDFPTKYKLFARTHIPFADNGCGNSIWIDTDTGVIKRLEHEEDFEEAIISIAPSFKDFCLSLEDDDPNWIKPIYDN